MAGAMRKVAVYLGLVEDRDRYGDDEYAYDEDYGHEQYEDAPADEYAHVPAGPVTEVAPARPERSSNVSSLDDRRPTPPPNRRPAARETRITTLHPRTYNEARTLGEHFRDGTPVIMNLSEMDDDDAKRLVDFAAGLIFGLRGSIERITAKVFLLSPIDVHVTAEDKARIADGDGAFFNQS